jgi:hypothetical protein
MPSCVAGGRLLPAIDLWPQADRPSQVSGPHLHRCLNVAERGPRFMPYSCVLHSNDGGLCATNNPQTTVSPAQRGLV